MKKDEIQKNKTKKEKEREKKIIEWVPKTE